MHGIMDDRRPVRVPEIMRSFEDTLTLRQALERHFRDSGLPEDGGYHDAWSKYTIGSMALWLPNFPARRRAVRLHDLHHILTGYDTTFRGETEVAAWELGSGCGNYFAAWCFDAGAVAAGVFLCPIRIWRAFRRGRASRSLYTLELGEHHLDWTVGEARRLVLSAERTVR